MTTFLTEDEVMDRLKLSRRTLQALRRSGKGPLYRRGSRKKPIYPVTEIEAWERSMLAQLHRSTTEEGMARRPGVRPQDAPPAES